MTLLAFEDVTKRHPDGRRELTVLDDVCFELDAGDFVGLWGMRRSGKSTLLRIAAGFESPDEGRVVFDGQDLTALSGDARAEVMRAGGIGLATADWRPSVSQEVIEYAREYLERMGVLNCAHMRTDRLSIGEAMRVSLAQALAREPRLLLVDEPAALPSPTERHELYDLLVSLGKSSGLAVLVASEDVGIVGRARRKMTIGSGTLRSMDKEGEVVSFPIGRAADGRSG
jgi:predicted ABC-type transport system involved in lysophospholipase L1 biosynthesis ATPase subunit